MRVLTVGDDGGDKSDPLEREDLTVEDVRCAVCTLVKDGGPLLREMV